MITDTDQFIYVDITDDMRKNAEKAAAEYRDKLSNSLLAGRGTVLGCLGEEMFHKAFPYMKRINGTEYDFLYDAPSGKKITFDIKTKARTVLPQLHYDCTVNKLNGIQKAGYYVFAQVLKDYSRGWILGMVKSKKYFDVARFIKEGEVDPSNDFTSRCDMWNLAISQLRPIKTPEGWTE